MGRGEVARDDRVDADVMAAMVYSMTERGSMGRCVCVRVCVQDDEGADAGEDGGGAARARCCVNSWLDGPAESTLQTAHHQMLLSGPRMPGQDG